MDAITLALTYIPLLQTPPLHLAIMVAKDSPLIIDCPPVKGAGISSTHGDLQAAIAKFRMTAYMWQALTAEDLRLKGLGRRAFRLEEEWTADTVSREFINAAFSKEPLRVDSRVASVIRATAKVHIVRSDKTTEELRNPDLAQQHGGRNNSGNRDQKLHAWFKDALAEAGGPFAAEARPVVAGLILDSHYSRQQDAILAHAALGGHDDNGISLGMFGSHLTYSWPRFLEEVGTCLVDTRNPGSTVANDNNECGSLWEACSIGQGAFLHEVGHAFGSPHRSGIMERGYSQYWPRNFLPYTAFCSAHGGSAGIDVVTSETPNEARWNIIDALSFMHQPQFLLPDDPELAEDDRCCAPQINFNAEEGEKSAFTITCGSLGIAQIRFEPEDGAVIESTPTAQNPTKEVTIFMSDIEKRFNVTQKMTMSIVGMNGQEKTVRNLRRLAGSATKVRIPGSTTVVTKKAVTFLDEESVGDRGTWDWAVLMKKKNSQGESKCLRVVSTTSIDRTLTIYPSRLRN